MGSVPGLGRSPREAATRSVFLPGESHGQRSLLGYSPWGHRELDTTESIAQQHALSFASSFSPFTFLMRGYLAEWV